MSEDRDDAEPGSSAAGELLKHLASRLRELTERPAAPEADGEGETLEAETLLGDAAAARATDIHLDPAEDRYRLRFRIDGQLVAVTTLEWGLGMKIVNQLRALGGLDPIRAAVPASGRFSFQLEGEALDVRVTEAPCIAGDKLTVRLLAPSRILADIRDLGLDQAGLDYLLGWLETVGGLLLTAGPTGSGKTTTLYAMLHQLKVSEAEVVTLEEPVEYAIAGINQLGVNPEQGLDFATGARGMLRMDPDYLVFGELREKASAEAAINAAAGGRATMATVHARDAVDTVAVLRNFGLSDLEIASNLDLVVAQRLVRRLCSECREPIELSGRDRAWLESQELEVPEQVCAGAGCQACGGLGYRGRVGLFELWRPTDDDYQQVVSRGALHELRSALAARGHRFLVDDGMAKVAAGTIALADLRRLGALGPARRVRGRG